MARCRRRKKRTADIILSCIFAAALVTFFVSAGMLLWYGWRSGTEKAANSALQQAVDNAAPEGAPAAGGSLPEDDTQKRLAAYRTLAAQNPDMVGWLTIPGTAANYAVMHTPSDPEYYLRRGFDKKYALSGALFLDAACSMETAGDNKIIYGHNMQDGTMFSVVADYKSKSFFAEHRSLWLDTLTQRFEYEVFAVLHVDTTYGEPDALAAYQRLTGGADTTAQQAYLDYLRTNRLYDTGVTASPGDTLVTLSTCDNITDTGRIVLVARRQA